MEHSSIYLLRSALTRWCCFVLQRLRFPQFPDALAVKRFFLSFPVEPGFVAISL
jgi:hypothetical protein